MSRGDALVYMLFLLVAGGRITIIIAGVVWFGPDREYKKRRTGEIRRRRRQGARAITPTSGRSARSGVGPRRPGSRGSRGRRGR